MMTAYNNYHDGPSLIFCDFLKVFIAIFGQGLSMSDSCHEESFVYPIYITTLFFKRMLMKTHWFFSSLA
jgi:hypothetical protein